MQSLINIISRNAFGPSQKMIMPTSIDLPEATSNFHSKYAIKDMLGSGGFGHIYSAVRKYDGKVVACKFIKRDKVPSNRWAIDSELGLVPMEVFIINNVHHQGVIEFHEIFNEDGYIIIVQELFGSVWNTSVAKNDQNTPNFASKTKEHKSMDLFELLDSRKLTEDEVKRVFKQIVEVSAYLYENHNLIHGDIKDENILIDSELNIKVIDFGGSERLNGMPLNAKKFHGTIEFASPEIIKGEKYCGQKAEVWALGCLVYGMMYSALPFVDTTGTVRSKVTKQSRPVNPLFLDLIDSCFQKNSERRITLDELVNHPWFST